MIEALLTLALGIPPERVAREIRLSHRICTMQARRFRPDWTVGEAGISHFDNNARMWLTADVDQLE